MLGIVKNNKIIPLTTDTGTGAPIGTLIQQYKKKPISGYLYCDGSTFDENAYPALYMYLGTNVLPDYRECVMVGAEQNTTDTIATHDVYGEGEFKDDQLQEHKHTIDIQSTGTYTGGYSIRGHTDDLGADTINKDTTSPINARLGTTTHGKQKAVYVYIKATSGLAENQQDNVLKDVKDYVDNSNSYSTEEIKTGGTWIDGKPIYRKVISNVITGTTQDVAHGIENIDSYVNLTPYMISADNSQIFPSFNTGSYFFTAFASSKELVTIQCISGYVSNLYRIVIEYTKTTD